MRKSQARYGYTLVEVIATIAIIGVLIAILFPALQCARNTARRATCQGHMRQIGVGLSQHVTAHGRFPPGRKWSRPPSEPGAFDIAWSTMLLKYLEERAIYQQIDFRASYAAEVNLPATGKVVSVYLCPSTSRIEEHRTRDGHLTGLGSVPGEGLACIDYLGVCGPHRNSRSPLTGKKYGRQRGILISTKGLPDEDKLLEPPAIRPTDVVDGMSHTMCVTECTGRGARVRGGVIVAIHGAWASGSNISHIAEGINSTDPPSAWHKERIFSEHPRGANGLMCDGSVHFLGNDTDEAIVRHLCTRDGGEVIPPL